MSKSRQILRHYPKSILRHFFRKTYKGNQTKLFLSRPHRLRLILNHVVILSKHVLPDLRLAFKASIRYTEWNATIRSTRNSAPISSSTRNRNSVRVGAL